MSNPELPLKECYKIDRSRSFGPWTAAKHGDTVLVKSPHGNVLMTISDGSLANPADLSAVLASDHLMTAAEWVDQQLGQMQENCDPDSSRLLQPLRDKLQEAIAVANAPIRMAEVHVDKVEIPPIE